MEGTGRIAERKHPAICAYAKGIAAERHWMPKRSDCSCPLHGIACSGDLPQLLKVTKQSHASAMGISEYKRRRSLPGGLIAATLSSP